MSLTFRMAAMKAPALALLILGGAVLAAPALAAGDTPPPAAPPQVAPPPAAAPPATEYMPPVTDEKLPITPPPDAELPSLPEPNTSAAQPELPTVPDPDAPATRKTVSSSPPSPPRVYDSQEVIKKIRAIDRARAVNAAEIAPADEPRPIPGPRYRVRPNVTLVNVVVQRYRIVYGPELPPAAVGYRSIYADDGYRPIYWPHRPHRVACRHGAYHRYDGCRPLLRVRG
jgi:hypothetical protein